MDEVCGYYKFNGSVIDFSKDTTLFVGANNSGKTSAMDALGKFLAGRQFVFNDFTISNRELINKSGTQWEISDCEKPDSILEWSDLLPSMDVWINAEKQDIKIQQATYLCDVACILYFYPIDTVEKLI